MNPLRAMLAAVFAGDRRVWRAAVLCAVPLLALGVFYCARPRFHYTGTDSVEDVGYVAHTAPRSPLCVAHLRLPARTAFVRLRVLTPTRQRPRLHLTLDLETGAAASRGGAGAQPAVPVASTLAPGIGPANRISNADFPVPRTPDAPAAASVGVCVTSAAPVSWAGTPLPAPPASPPTVAAQPLPARIAVWYLPAAGSRQSYLQRVGAIFDRAALFRPGFVGAWTYALVLALVLPALALAAVRCLALATAGRGRRLALALFAIAAANACCWALITPAFQAPDEVDHFAYAQSLVARGHGPSNDAATAASRWSSAESLALTDTDFPTDHQLGDSRVPWLATQQRQYQADVRRAHPPAGDGGGYTTSAVHGPIYYMALAPAYALARHDSIFTQLTLMRLTSALIGALVALFTFLLARELAPGRPWLAVLAALLVAFQPMYGFVSGIVNNDVGVNALAAALELLLIRMLRRGITVPWGALTGVVLVALPLVKGTGLSLYPVAALVFLATLWRHHSRADLLAFAALALGALAMAEISAHALDGLQAHASVSGSAAIDTNAGAAGEALHHIPSYLEYVWQAVLPTLPGMVHHFPPHHGFALTNDPGFTIFVQRGWAAFGWYDVLFPKWVYVVILIATIATPPLGAWAARREWAWVRRNWLELIALIAMPVAVVLGFEAAYYTQAPRPAIAEFGRYAFPAIGPVAVLVVGALHAFGRRRMLFAGVALLVGMVALSFASQLLTLTSFYA